MAGLFGGGQTAQNISETPLAGINVQTSANGRPIPLVYGTTRVTPNLIGYYDFTAIPHTSRQSSGGKGGGYDAPTNTTYTYAATLLFALCEGPIAAVQKAWIDKTESLANEKFTIFTGTIPQTPWSVLATRHPAEAIGYSGIAYVAADAYDLGSRASLPNHNFEVQGKCLAGNGLIDANPRDILVDLLTNATTGVPNAPTLGDTTAYAQYSLAAGLLLSPCYSEPTTAASILTDLLKLTNTGIYYSDGQLKLVPYGDEPINGNGATYLPNLTPVANLTDDDFIAAAGDDPIKIKRNAIAQTTNTTADAYNQVTIEYLNRATQYQIETVIRDDPAAIETYGLIPMSPVTAHHIADAAIAGKIADLLLQRAITVRAQYTFRLGWQWCYLEPTDLVTLTDQAIGMSLYPVRILSIEEDDDGTLTLTAEDAPPGAASFVVKPIPQSGGYHVDYNAAAEPIGAVCLFEPPYALARGSGLELWVGACGPTGTSTWGGCHVWVSTDGDAYRQIGTLTNPSRIGTLTSPISPASTTLSVQLTGQGGQLIPASAADAAALHTLFYVGGANPEFMAHQGAILTGADAYNLTGLVRGAYGSTIAPHSIGDPFIRLDDTIVKSGPLDLSLIGQTIYLKFQSFNVWGSGLQPMESLPVHAHAMTGQQATGSPVAGLSVTAMPGSAVLTRLAWDPSPGADHYIIDQSGDGETWYRTGETKDTTWSDSSLFGASTRYRVAAVRALAGSWSSPAFINISTHAMWTSDSAAMWTTDSTPMWSA